jgi:GT2 family glycosyltransferase
VDPETQQVPPVVAVVVVHDPGPWFDDTVAALADQDYPNLRFLFLITESAANEVGDDSTETRIKLRIPGAFVRSLGANPGFGPAANEVLRLVEGDNGFFLICHDDVAPAPDALRIMVEELYRSNAGAVGPKIVDWDEPRVLQSVGLGMDRFGEIDPVIESGEVDQEQHDGVRDMFVLPSAFFLIRSDLFRELGGFAPSINFYGEDVELCWRIHDNGARVIVAPSARVRHRDELWLRRPDLSRNVLSARHRMFSVATLTAASRLPGRSFELVILTLSELVVGLFTARFGEAWASLRGLLGLIPRTPAILSRRREVKAIRSVPEREVIGLQESGSARLNSYLRSHDTATYVGADTEVRRWRESATAPVIAWIAVVVAILIGSRTFFGSGVPAVGEFLPFPDSPRLMLDSFVSGWNGNGAGATSSNPTGWATLAGLSVVTLFRMGMLHTLLIVGTVLIGVSGMWKLATVFPSTRARIAALVVYAASPLVSGAMSGGQLTVLIVYAATPWMIHLFRRAVGVETADPRSAELDLVDGLVNMSWQEQFHKTLVASMALAVAVAFAPVMLPVALTISVLLGVGTLLALAPWRTALRYVGVGVAATVGAALLNLPWLTTWYWEGIVGAPPIGDPHRGLLELASFEIGRTDFAALAIALYIPVIAAVALARAWRLTWAVRSGVLVLGFGALVFWSDSGSLPFIGPEAGVLLVPVAAGVAMSAAAALAAFDLDVRGGSFGWRQPLGILASIAVVIGIAPGIAALADGGWQTPTTPLARLIEASLPGPTPDGDYNVLLIGDARILPVPSTEYRDGMAWAIMDDGALDTRDRWMPPTNEAAELVNTALDEMAASTTLRAGRLLAPLGIRYIVVPEFDGVVSTADDPLPLPGGLTTSLEDQLDLVSTRGLPTIEVFENRAWLPTYALLEGESAGASASAGAEVLVRTDSSDSRAVFIGADQFGTTTDEVAAGVVHVAVPFDDNWSLVVDGEPIEPRRAFGVTTAFDVAAGGVGELRYDTSSTRSLLVALQVVLWVLVIFAAARISVPRGRSATLLVTDETLIDLDNDMDLNERNVKGQAPDVTLTSGATGLDPGLDITGQIARLAQADGDVARDDDDEVPS